MRLGSAGEIRKYQLFGIGGFELFIILLFAFLIFGPDKLPEAAKTLGVALNKFKQAQEEMKAVINDEVWTPMQAKKPHLVLARSRPLMQLRNRLPSARLATTKNAPSA